MEQDEKLYRAFLEEMSSLENFRMAYASEHPGVPLEREDPDVRRLMETIAFFAARTRQAGLRSLEAVRRRMVRQFLPYLLAPTPAMAVVQALPTGKFVESVTVPRGSELAMRAGMDRTAIVRTLKDLTILPVSLGRVDTLTRERGGYRLLLPFSASFARNDEIGALSFYISYLNDFRASLRVVDAIRRHLLKAQVSFAERVEDNTDGETCTLRYGLPELESVWPHPIERERLHFGFPAADLFVEVQVPPPPRNWKQFTLCLDFDPGWPRALRLTREAFNVFATPVMNLQRAFAQPIVHDGSQELWPIRHPVPAAHNELHSVKAVYHTDGESMTPLRPAVLAASVGAYEIDDDPRPASRGSVLGLRLPEGFDDPWTLAVDAEWYQPWLSQALNQKLHIAPYRQNVPGLDWEVVGDAVPHREVEADDGMATFIQVLGLQHKSLLDKDDLQALLAVLGTPWAGPYASLRDLVDEVSVREVPLAQAGGAAGVKLVYTIRFREHEPAVGPLIDSFLVHLERLLDAWIAAAPVEVRLGEPA